MDAAVCWAYFSGLISMFVSDILLIPSGRATPLSPPWLGA